MSLEECCGLHSNSSSYWMSLGSRQMFGAKLFPSAEQFSAMCNTHSERALGFRWTPLYSWIFYCKTTSACRIGISKAEHTFFSRVMFVYRLRDGLEHKDCWTYPSSFQALLSTDFTTAAYTRLVNVS